jgi:hypothetical protein
MGMVLSWHKTRDVNLRIAKAISKIESAVEQSYRHAY